MTDTTAGVAAAVARLRQQRGALAALTPSQRAGALALAAQLLADRAGSEGSAAREKLAASTGLSPQMVDWALRATLRPLTARRLERALPRAAARWLAVPPRLVTLILAGNVFSAGAAPLLLSLLAGSPVFVKASRREEHFASLFAAALATVEPGLRGVIEVTTVPGDAAALEAAFGASDLVVAYGRDETLAEIGRRLPAGTRFVGHGHGIGVAFVPRTVLADPASATRAAAALAFDVAAYDQRGCLSPQTVFVERSRGIAPRQFAVLLHAALGRVERRLPRGGLAAAAAAEQVQWRGVAAATAELWDGVRYATVYRPDQRWMGSCGGRNVEVLSCGGIAELVEQIQPLGVHLKAIGVGGERVVRRQVAAALAPPLCPTLSRLGAMQRPTVFGLADGAPSSEQVLRFIDCGV